MKWRNFILTMLGVFMMAPVTDAIAQGGTDGILTLDRIFTQEEFKDERFGPARWVDDGEGYTTLEEAVEGDDGLSIIRYQTKSGKREVLVPAGNLIPEGADTSLYIDDYQWSSDKQKLLIFTNTKRVWRKNTRGDYWLLNMKSKELTQLGGDAPPSRMMFATFSPDGKKICYVVNHNLYVQDLDSGNITQLTDTGSETVINGTFDWVYEEEFGLRNGFRWSPDNQKIAYWQINAEGVGVFNMINNTDSIYSKVIPIQYPKVGTTNSICRIGIVGVEGGETRWMNLEDDLRNNYVCRLEWGGNSDEIVIQRLNRLQNHLRVMLGDIKSGDFRTIHSETDEAWVDVRKGNVLWIEDGKRFVWASETDGWRHIYIVSRDGKEKKLITPGEFDVVEVQRVDEKGGWLYYIASPDNPTQRYLYRSKLDGSGKAERLSPESQPGTHQYDISPNAKWAIHKYSNYNTPTVTTMINLPDHKPVRPLAENKVVQEKVAALNRQPVEFFRVDIGDGVEFDAWCMKPHDFDPEKKYPLFFFVYGEPAGQTVLDKWGGNRYLWHTMLTQLGYVVISVDNQGTPGPRGRAWRKSIYRKIGITASEDQAAAAKVILKNRPYLDDSRVGIWGWSGGGSMSLNMIFRYPEIYHTAMAIAFVADQRNYDTIYQERYMGLPDDNADGFKNGSPITFANQLEGNLLIIYGTGDDNCHYQNAEMLVNELIKHNKYFSMVSYPNRTHAIKERENTTRHLYETLTTYLTKHLPPGPVSPGQSE